MNPLDMAIETVSSKIKEIHRVTVDIAGNPALNINPLSMLLKGVIDAAVMGGISNFEKVCAEQCDTLFCVQVWHLVNKILHVCVN